MVSGPDDDFSTFLEFGDLQLNFPHFDQNSQNGGEIQDGVRRAMDMQASNNSGPVLDFHHPAIQQYGDPSALGDFNTIPQPFSDPTMPSELFEQHQQLQQMPQHPSYGPTYNGQHMVPPTPNSIEMHGGQMHYQQPLPNSHARAVYEYHRRQPNGQVLYLFHTVERS